MSAVFEVRAKSLRTLRSRFLLFPQDVPLSSPFVYGVELLKQIQSLNAHDTLIAPRKCLSDRCYTRGMPSRQIAQIEQERALFMKVSANRPSLLSQTESDSPGAEVLFPWLV